MGDAVIALKTCLDALAPLDGAARDRVLDCLVIALRGTDDEDELEPATAAAPDEPEDDEEVVPDSVPKGKDPRAAGRENVRRILEAMRACPDGMAPSKIGAATGMASWLVASICKGLLMEGKLRTTGTPGTRSVRYHLVEATRG